MITAKLIDNIWATRKAVSLQGYKLMLAEVIGGTQVGRRMVVVDTIGAGIVLVTTILGRLSSCLASRRETGLTDR